MNRLIGNLSIVLLSLLPIWTWAANEGEPQQYRELNVVGITGQQSYHLKCAGQGSPTIFLDGGLKYWSIHYLHLLESLGSLTTTCLYDRPGYGESQKGRLPRTVEQNAIDIAHAIEAAEIPLPIVMGGHSLGGVNALGFTSLFRDLVAGIVLIDSAHPDQYEQFPVQLVSLQNEQTNRFWRYSALLANGDEVDLTREVPVWLDEASQREMLTRLRNPANFLAFASEMDSFAQTSTFLRGNYNTQLEIPLVVLTALNSFDLYGTLIPEDIKVNAQKKWFDLQKDLLSYSKQSTQLFSNGHHSLEISDPDKIIAAFKIVLSQIDQ